MNDAEVLDFLRAGYDTFSCDGLNKSIPGQFGGTGREPTAAVSGARCPHRHVTRLQCDA